MWGKARPHFCRLQAWKKVKSQPRQSQHFQKLNFSVTSQILLLKDITACKGLGLDDKFTDAQRALCVNPLVFRDVRRGSFLFAFGRQEFGGI